MFELHPLVILAVGIATVVGMILVLRINAFIALITAAIVVSLLAPGSVETKISRVAESFGVLAGRIGIVIALAAVIGTCMMDSGAADKIVRAFLKVLGQKRASFALMGSGFVLAVPVFFDTVFLLLVPLARSLHRRTHRNYLLYLMAIAAGGAITHTLVPPTPGPLVMAATLDVDLGMMIMIGALVALPAALVGVAVSIVCDRVMPVPMRQVEGAPEPEPLDDSQLPSLLLSLLPVILPVLMISTNTVLTTLADAEHAAALQPAHVTDWDTLRAQLTDPGSEASPAGRAAALLDDDAMAILRQEALTDEQKAQVTQSLNQDVLLEPSFYDPEAFEQVLLPAWRIAKLAETPSTLAKGDQERFERIPLATGMLTENVNRMKKVRLERLNRLLMEVAFPGAIEFHEWNTPKRRAADWSALLGDPNMALLLSTVVAMLLLYRQRRPTLTEMGAMVETSLLSAGVIILITAAGGAFGGMLQLARIDTAIQDLFSSSATSGLLYLFIGFGVASLLKVAQGSSTAAMIVGSAMLAAMTASTDLGFHRVYLATAIGSGSLVGSWMNDSGFWVFAKMGGLTEAESLKSWSILLVVLGVTGMVTTIVLSMVMPLV